MGQVVVVQLESKLGICNLSEHAEWIPLIALWHHNEWLKTYNGLSGRFRSADVIKQRLTERQNALTKHLSGEPLPTTFVAHSGDEPLGTVSLVYYQFSKDQQSTEWVTNLFVLPAYRRHGIASKLLQYAIDYAAVMRLSRLLLYTSDQMDFYRKRHWRSVSQGVVQGEKVEIMDYLLS